MGGRVVAAMLSAAGCEFIGLFRGGRSKVAPPYISLRGVQNWPDCHSIMSAARAWPRRAT